MSNLQDRASLHARAAIVAVQGRVTSALALYDQLLAADPDDAESWLQKGLLHLDFSDFTAAWEALERARRLAPGDARIPFHLGLIALSFGRPRTAIALFQAARALDPHHGECAVNLANALLVLGRSQAAAAITEPMGDDLPGWWASTRDRAREAAAAARARAQELVALRTSRGAPLERPLALELARLFLALDRPAATREICQRLRHEDVSDLDALLLEVRAVVQGHGLAEGLAALEAAGDRFGEAPAFALAMASLAFDAGDLDRALVHAEATRAADPRAYATMLLAGRRWGELFGFARDWMASTDDTSAFAVLLRAAAGLGRMRLFHDDATGSAPPGPIPAVIVQFWDSDAVPEDVGLAIASWRDRNPGFEHRLFSEARARAFIVQAHGEAAAQAFDRCHHAAMKADFFRVAYLAVEGGVYVDADDACARPMGELLAAIGNARFAASLSSDVAPYVHNWFLAAAPAHPVLRSALVEMIAGIDRAHAEGVTADIWHSTGPGLITRAVARWLAGSPGASGEAVFLTSRQYRGFAVGMEALAYKKTTAGNWRRKEEKTVETAKAVEAAKTVERAGAAAGAKNMFDAIYDNESWGNGSGPGSHPYWTIEYRAFLEKFLRMNEVRSIVDIGCGDWQFSRFVNLDGISYHGFDVVERLIEANRRRFGGPSIRFDVMPEDLGQLPAGDLLLMKDVLQHLPDAEIFRFREQLFGRYRFVLLTNSFEKIDAYRNVDLSRPGEFRCLDLAATPYAFPGAYLFEYWAQPWERIRAFLMTNPQA